MPLDPQAVYNNLLAHPSATLRTYLFRVHGSPDLSGLVKFRLTNHVAPSQRPSFGIGTLKMRDTESFEIRLAEAPHGIPPANSFVFYAHSIRMDVGLAARNPYVLGISGPRLVVTGQLTGCSIVMTPGPARDEVQVAHVQPAGGMPPAELATTALAQVPTSQVYGGIDATGNYDPYDREVAIIGVRTTAGRWVIYAQKQEPTLQGLRRIKSVYQIWPERVKQW